MSSRTSIAVFFQVSADAVCQHLAEFFEHNDVTPIREPHIAGDEGDADENAATLSAWLARRRRSKERYEFLQHNEVVHVHEKIDNGHLVVLRLLAGRRSHNRFNRPCEWVSRKLSCKGLLCFRCDSNWGFEVFDKGKPLSYFIQDALASDFPTYYPGINCPGDVSDLKDIANIPPDELARYLVQAPLLVASPLADDASEEERERWFRADEIQFSRSWKRDVKVRPDDEYLLTDSYLVFDFLRHFGVDVCTHNDPLPEDPFIQRFPLLRHFVNTGYEYPDWSIAAAPCVETFYLDECDDIW